eukprot:6375764-Prymnesium_polylepis.1
MGALTHLNVDGMDFHHATPVCCVMHAAAGDVMYIQLNVISYHVCELTADLTADLNATPTLSRSAMALDELPS